MTLIVDMVHGTVTVVEHPEVDPRVLKAAQDLTLSIAIDGVRRPEATIPFRVVEQPV